MHITNKRFSNYICSFGKQIRQTAPFSRIRTEHHDTFNYSVKIHTAQKNKADNKSEIKFKNASKIEDAVKFGREVLGIEHYIGFENEDTDVVNWINEGLLNLIHRSHGRAVMPKAVVFADLDNCPASMTRSGILCINSAETRAAKEFFCLYSEHAEKFASIPKHSLYKEIRRAIAHPECSFIETYIHNSTFSIIYHELGHWQHCNNIDSELFSSLDKPCKLPDKLADGAEELRRLFYNSRDITSKISEYAQESPLEFAAECYSMMAEGIKLDKDTEALYRKIGGVMLPAV